MTYTALVLTSLCPKSPARQACGAMVMGLRAKGWGSTIPRERVRHMIRACVAEGIFVVLLW